MGHIDLVVAGWDCQGFSLAGRGKGLADERSGLVVELLQVMAWVQAINPRCAYIFENMAMQMHPQEHIRRMVVLNYQLGQPLLVDAMQMGSYAHRVRNFWTNLAPVELLQVALLHTQRNPHACLQDILEPGHVPREVTWSQGDDVYLSY